MAQRFIGLDLTDPYAKKPRDVDIAVVDASMTCQFHRLPTSDVFHPTSASWLKGIHPKPDSDDVVVIDGPLALAAPLKNTRECERLLGTPGHTGHQLPQPGALPFAGYIRGSVELAHKLVALGWRPYTGDLDLANLLEAYPGKAWPVLANGPLPHKTTPAGRSTRIDLLRRCGLRFPTAPATHDELDAAVCALIGVLARRHPPGVDLVGIPVTLPPPPPGHMREGVIAMPLGPCSGTGAEPPPPSKEPPAPSGSGPSRSVRRGKPDWIYFATPARAGLQETTDFAVNDGVLICAAYNRAGHFKANVPNVQVGDRLLLAFGQGTYQAIGIFTIAAVNDLVPGTHALERRLASHLTQRVARYYPADPILKRFTAFLLDDADLSIAGAPVQRPGGRNALVRHP